VGRRLGTLPLKGLAFVRGRWHVGNDSAGGKRADDQLRISVIVVSQIAPS
jgi:hypothetical protein